MATTKFDKPVGTEIESLNGKITNGMFASQGTAIAQNTDLNNIVTPGTYYSNSQTVTQTLLNSPYKYGGFRFFVFGISGRTVYQLLFPNSTITGRFWMRLIYTDGSNIGNWFLIQGTEVT